MAQIMQIEVIPEKPHIKISNKTINVPKELKYIATQFDHAAEKVTFDCPKIVGENINLLDTVLYVNYRLPDGSMSAHKVENVRVDETDEGIIHFDWTFTRNVTQYKGDIYFLVCAVKTDVSGNQILRWSTTLNSEISVTEGIEGTETIDEQYPDIITQILQNLAFKQDVLVSGENIKTINGKSVLGGGDIVIDGEGTKNYDDLINKPRINGVELAGNRTAKELKITFDVDNTFDPESKNAQSGVAVKEATTELENKYFDVAYNMFTPETVTENTKISETDGTEVLSVGYSTSDYIELPTSGSYVAKSTEDYTFAIYTGSNKRFVALVPAENPQSSIYMPDEMLPAFIRITFPTVDLNVVQINQGTTLLPYDDGRTKLRPEYYDTVSGKDGKSAYEIALGNGFEGSEEDWLASLKGEQGEAGKDGTDGTSVTISSITENTEDSGNNVITFSDGNSVTIKNGSKGSKGDKGEQGIQGVQGEKGEQGNAGKDGTSITVDIVSESPSDGGNNIVTFSDGSTLTVKNGNKGSKGDKGDTGTKGADGAKGVDGISATHSWNGTVLTVTSASGTSSADLKGEKGEQGTKGDTGAKGDKGNDGHTPVKGVDYFTEADKQEMVDEVVEKISTDTLPPITIESKTGGYYNIRYEWKSINDNNSKQTNKLAVTAGDMFSYYGMAMWQVASAFFFDSEDNLLSYAQYNTNENSPAKAIVVIPDGVTSVVFQSFRASTDPAILEVSWIKCQAAGYALANSVLSGKKIVYDGDSICAGTSGGGGYAKIIADTIYGTFDNQSVGGGRLRTQTGSSDTFHSVVDNLTNLPTDGDMYCFEGGINDYWTYGNLGTYDNSYDSTLDKTTVCGALETIFRYALNTFVGKPICFIITHKIQSTAYTANSNGNTFKDYHDKMVGLCEKYSIPYYDAFNESGLNGWNTVQNNAYLTGNSSGTADGTHPNTAGYKKYYVPQLISLFESITER